MGKFLDAVEEKIETLTKNVEALGDDGFNERTRLDVHDLLCTLRLAIWEDEASFVEWLDGKTHEINPNILKRIILKGGEKDAQGKAKDGVELRFHIFKGENDTFIHNHRQDFITIPLTGMYKYTWWLEDPTQEGEYFVWERAKGGDLTPKGTEKGVLLPARVGPDFSLEALPKGQFSGMFQGGDPPMFVYHKWLHKIEYGMDEDDLMVTFVVRRGQRHPLTRVVSEKNDADEGNENVLSTKEKQLTMEQKREIQQSVVDALRPPGLQTSLNENSMSPKKDAFSHLQNYITPTVNLLRVNKSDFEVEENLNHKVCTALMKSNRFNFLPLMNDDGSCSEFLSVDIFNQDESKKITPPRLALNHHALSAILWTIGSREFVCPVWDEQQQRLAGIFALDNLKGNQFRDALLLSLVSPEALAFIKDETQRKSISGERVAYANQLVDTLSALDDFVFSSDQVALDSDEMDELIHRAMLSLGPLINMTANIDLPNVSREPQSTKEATLGNWARFPMFVLNVDDPNQPFDNRESVRALELIFKGAQYSQLALISPTKQKLLTRMGGKDKPELSALKVYDSNTELHQIITEFSKLSRPLFVKNEEGDYGIFSIYEFKQDHVFPQFQAYIYDAIGAISDDETKNSLLNQFGEVCHALFTDESEETEEAFQKLCQNLVHAS